MSPPSEIAKPQVRKPRILKRVFGGWEGGVAIYENPGFLVSIPGVSQSQAPNGAETCRAKTQEEDKRATTNMQHRFLLFFLLSFLLFVLLELNPFVLKRKVLGEKF